MSGYTVSSFWAKAAGGIMTAGFISIVGMSYKINTSIAVIEADMDHMVSSIENVNDRLTKIEDDRLNAKQFREIFELKLQALTNSIILNKNAIEDMRNMQYGR